MRTNKHTARQAPAICPVCGEDVPAHAAACPNCGADHKSGWREDAATYDGIDLGDERFDYDTFVRDEFGGGAKPSRIHAVWWITALVLAAALLAIYISAR